MGYFLLLYVVFLSLEGSKSESSCEAVQITGPYIPSQIRTFGAVLRQIQVDTNSLPVFARDIGDGNRLYLYCYVLVPNYASYWAVSTTYGSVSPGLRHVLGANELCKSHPADDRRTWEAETSSYQYTPFPDIRVKCTEAQKPHAVKCSAIRIAGPTIPYQVRRQQRIFKSTGQSRCGRPVFNATRNEVIVYDCITFAWVVAQLNDRNQNLIFHMYVISTVAHPVEVTGTWYAREGVSNSSFNAFPTLSMECVEGSTPFPLPGKTTNTPKNPLDTNTHRPTTVRPTIRVIASSTVKSGDPPFSPPFLPATTAKHETGCSAMRITGPFIPSQFQTMGAVFQQLQVDTSLLPVFFRDIGDGNRLYLYCYVLVPDYYSYWAVSTTYGSVSAGLKQILGANELCKSHPADDTRTWEAETSSYLYTPFPDIRVDCTAAPKPYTVSCNSIRITGPTIPYQARRQKLTFTSKGQTRCGRPVFNATRNEVIAYDCISFAWVVAQLNGQTQDLLLHMFVISTVSHPVEATGTWYARDGVSNSSFKAFPALSMECVDDTASPLTSTIATSTPTGASNNPTNTFHTSTRRPTTTKPTTRASPSIVKSQGPSSSPLFFPTTTRIEYTNTRGSTIKTFTSRFTSVASITTGKAQHPSSSTRFFSTPITKEQDPYFSKTIPTLAATSPTVYVGTDGSDRHVTTFDDNSDEGSGSSGYPDDNKGTSVDSSSRVGSATSGDNMDDDNETSVDNSGDGNGSPNIGAIVGSTIAAVVVVGLVIVVAWQRWKIRKQQQGRSRSGPTGNSPIQPSDSGLNVRYSVTPTYTSPLYPSSRTLPSVPPTPPCLRNIAQKLQGDAEVNTPPGVNECKTTETIYEDLTLYDEPPVEDINNYDEANLSKESKPPGFGYIDIVPELPYEYIPSTNANNTTNA